MNQEPESFGERATKMVGDAAAFQKIWMETLSKMTQTGFTFSPESPPPEMFRQMRGGIFRALAESWEQFLRSPQFLKSTKNWQENATAFRKMTNDLLTRTRHELQAPSREDVDTIMLTVRHMEKRILDRMEEVSSEVAALNARLDNAVNSASPAASGAPRPAQAAANRRRTKTPTKTSNLTSP